MPQHSFFYPHRIRVTVQHSDIQMTKQSAKDECDINKILSQYKMTGIIAHVQAARPSYMDLPDIMDYQDALNIQMAADAAFASLPSKVRDHFQNDPATFLAAFQDADQADKLREFGLLNALPPAPPASPPAAPPAPPAPTSKAPAA